MNFAGCKRADIAKNIPYKSRLFEDSKTAGYAEVWISSNMHNAFYLNLNDHIGGTIIVDNEIYEGNMNKSGNIGHMTVQMRDGIPCCCGKKGCFDTVCSTKKLESYAKKNLSHFFSLLDSGDTEAKKL